MQAVHDLLHLPFSLSKFDHLEFPGVVPRTFLGAICNALLAAPLAAPLALAGAPRFAALLITRAALAFLSSLGLACFRFALGQRFGHPASVAFACVCAVQFHGPFYASRTLPNTYAGVLSPPPSSLPYKVDKSRPSFRTNWTRLLQACWSTSRSRTGCRFLA